MNPKSIENYLSQQVINLSESTKISLSYENSVSQNHAFVNSPS